MFLTEDSEVWKLIKYVRIELVMYCAGIHSTNLMFLTMQTFPLLFTVQSMGHLFLCVHSTLHS